MPRRQKTPQEKKRLELEKNHFTFTEYPHAFRKNWNKKKSRLNRLYRRKGGELLAKAKPEISPDDAELLIGDVTSSHLQNSVSAKRLKKTGTVTVGEKIRIKLEKRARGVGRRINQTQHYDSIIKSAVNTLLALDGKELSDVVERISRAIQGGDPIEWTRLYHSTNALDRAVFFVIEISHGNGFYVDALRRNEQLCESFQLWEKKASRILAKQRRPAKRKLEQRTATEKRIKTELRQKRKS